VSLGPDPRNVVLRVGTHGLGAGGAADANLGPRTVLLPYPAATGNLSRGRAAHGGAADPTWEQVVRLDGSVEAPARVVPAALSHAVAEAGRLVLTVCSRNKSGAHGLNQKRATTSTECLRWHATLRAVYKGPVGITMGDAPSPDLEAAAAADTARAAAGGGGTWLLSELESRLPKHPTVALPLGGRSTAFRGNQLRIVWCRRRPLLDSAPARLAHGAGHVAGTRCCCASSRPSRRARPC
jgi:hypothetical protein